MGILILGQQYRMLIEIRKKTNRQHLRVTLQVYFFLWKFTNLFSRNIREALCFVRSTNLVYSIDQIKYIEELIEILKRNIYIYIVGKS